MGKIRKACTKDASRIAEILVFSKRKNYRTIFNNDIGSFVELQVYPIAKEYIDKPELLSGIYVYEDSFIKGMMHIDDSEITNLYIDPFFERNGIGGELIEFAASRNNYLELWVIDKNERAKHFYEKHGFCETEKTRRVPEAPDSNILERKMIRNKTSK
ncbi:GNAT family N-acetyltransferase [Candidatus Saccharibacteria bacterium]|nr:GNAT family N-acetyltransferase [Candidatus Saccharibacteria bacterium]